MYSKYIRMCALLIGFFWVSTAFSPIEDPFLSAVQEETLQGIHDLDGIMLSLEEALAKSSDDDVRRIFHKARRTYKHHEYILEYFHHSSINKKINGAPLPKMEEHVADLNVLPPEGLQRIEELVYEDLLDREEIKKLASKLRKELRPMKLYHERIALYDRHLIEAVRYELIRLYTLGITGFENPASDSSLSEVLISFLSLKDVSLHYAQKAGTHYETSVADLFEQGEQQLRSSDFATLDRLAFLKEVNDPLFAILFDIHTELGIETHEEVNTAPVATNYRATSLFDIDLLNKDYFLKYRSESISKAEVELGRTLFFDPALSFNNSLACSSCHHPDKAFTDGLPKSMSNDEEHSVGRNAPTLVNALFSGAYFHDLRAGRLDMQTEHVMTSPEEFNIRPLDLAEKLRQSDGYVELFQDAFPGAKEPVQPRMIKRSLAAYVATLVSWDSPFDQYVRNERQDIDASVVNGYNIFMGKGACGTCHFAPNFNGIVPPFYDDTESEVLGVTTSSDSNHLVLDTDLGRFENGIRTEHADHFKFSMKTPTIRNVELTGPYFHNGAYATLEDVMWFYNQGGGLGLGLNIPNQTLPPDPLNLTQQEISDVIAFMKSLTDISHFQQDPPSLPDFESEPELQNRTANAY